MAYPTPSQAERMIDELTLSPEMEAWLIGSIQEYTFAMNTLMGLYAKAGIYTPTKETTR